MSPSKYRLRTVFEGLVLRIARPFAKRNVSPNALTYFTILLAFIACLTLILTQWQPLYGILVFMVGLFDGVDGAVARLSDRQSAQGAFTDSFADKVAEAILLLSIALAFPLEEFLTLSVPIWCFLCYVGWILTSYSRAIAYAQGVRDLDIGLGGRSERLFILFLFALSSLLVWGVVIVTILGLLTAGFRYWHYKHEIITRPAQ